MVFHKGLDAYGKPPEDIRNMYKKYQRMKPSDLYTDKTVVDFEPFGNARYDVGLTRAITYSNSYHLTIPGLFIYPSLLPSEVQLSLLSLLLHRDLSNPAHKTNVHMHYSVPYPSNNASFFSYQPRASPAFQPLDPAIRKPLSIAQVLARKLRWMTLGGQYDWTNKVYPAETPPPFPPDIAELLSGLFPMMRPQAAICNFYSPGDTLSMHRDVSEECDRPLVSVSIGCDAVFVAGLSSESPGEPSKTLSLRLRSGDAVVMSGPSRFAWHGVPQIVGGTCPEWLRDWPAEGGSESIQYEQWRGWMTSKRINLNVRQMWD
ncbi:alkylated DNA repair protein AlkB [Cryomyces antarcticus]